MKIVTDAFQTGTARYQPVKNLSHEEQVDQRRMAFIVGLVAIGLPSLLILVGLFLSTCFYDSISHYYYAQFWGSVFIGCLVFIGTYLLVWQGNSDGERTLATIAGPFAWGIALFPTSGAGCTETRWEGRILVDLTYDGQTVALDIPADPARYFELTSWAETLHLISAGILFLILAFFALRVFTRIVPERDLQADGQTKPAKRKRNAIYRACGRVMVLCILLLGVRASYQYVTGTRIAFWNVWNMTLVLEAIALYAFGLSWMVKGRFLDRWLMDS